MKAPPMDLVIKAIKSSHELFHSIPHKNKLPLDMLKFVINKKVFNIALIEKPCEELIIEAINKTPEAVNYIDTNFFNERIIKKYFLSLNSYIRYNKLKVGPSNVKMFLIEFTNVKLPLVKIEDSFLENFDKLAKEFIVDNYKGSFCKKSSLSKFL